MVLVHSPSPLWVWDQKSYYLIGVSLQVMYHFSLAAFKSVSIIFSLQEFSCGVFWRGFLWIYPVVVVVQSLSPVWLFVSPWTIACQSSLAFTISWSLLKLMSIESVMLSNYLILCHPLLLLPLIFFSIRVFSNKPALWIRWPKYWNFSISPSNKYSGLISFRIDWFDLLAVQGTPKSLLKHQLSLWSSSHICTQLLEKPVGFDYTDLCQQSDVSLLCNTLSRFVTALLPRSKCLLISWLQMVTAAMKLKEAYSLEEKLWET